MKNKVVEPFYNKDESGELWWCNSHNIKATHLFHRPGWDFKTQEIVLKPEHVCEPGLGGILLPCSCVNLTDILEIIEEEKE